MSSMHHVGYRYLLFGGILSKKTRTQITFSENSAECEKLPFRSNQHCTAYQRGQGVSLQLQDGGCSELSPVV